MMKNKIKTSSFKLLLLTPLFILLSQYLVIFLHEYAHAFTAWILGYKDNPFDINYGGTSIANLLLLSNINQKVNNNLIYAAGHPGHVALIASAGPVMVMLLFFISYWVIKNKKNNPYLLYFMYFFNLWCLAGTFAYVPIRTFATEGYLVDVLDIENSLHISPWYIYFFIGYLVCFMMWLFFTKVLIKTYITSNISGILGKASLMVVTVIILFGYCGLAGFDYGEISHFVSVTSIFAIPGILIALWPTRKWVKLAIHEMNLTLQENRQ